MGFFGGKKEEKKADGNTGAAVKVLGAGCKKCNELEENVKTALTKLGMNPTVGHVTDFAQIAAYGVMVTPALVIDEKVVLAGRVASADEIAGLLQKAQS